MEDGGDKAVQSEVSLTELIEGLATDDHRLRDEVVGLLRSATSPTEAIWQDP